MGSQFPFIKLISAENMVGFSEGEKVGRLNKVFSDSYKSPFSVIVVDGIERILGTSFSSPLALAFCLRLFGHRLGTHWPSILEQRPASAHGPPQQAPTKGPPSLALTLPALAHPNSPLTQGRRLLILCTTSNRSMLTDMDVMDAFGADIRVPAIDSLAQLNYVLRDVELFRSQEEEQRSMQLLSQAGFEREGRLNIGVKKLLSLAEMCRQGAFRASLRVFCEF